MQLDLRVPLGWLFGLLGAVLVGDGLVVGAEVQGINVNLLWGLVLLSFGGGALALARRSRS